VIDRASILTAAIFHVIRTCGIGAEAREQITTILRDELHDVARTTLNEIRLREDE
jgi:hypothetical protein